MVGFGLLGGLILNLMPCVLPVIGLKVLSFAQQGGHSRAKIFSLNLWFALGLLSVFLRAGDRRGAIRRTLGWGQQFTYTWFKVAMVVLVFAFALSFLGVWEVPIPGFAQSHRLEQAAAARRPGGRVLQGHLHDAARHALQRAVPRPGLRLHARPAAAGDVHHLHQRRPRHGLALSGHRRVSRASSAGCPSPASGWKPSSSSWASCCWARSSISSCTINNDVLHSDAGPGDGVWLACWIIGRVPDL